MTRSGPDMCDRTKQHTSRVHGGLAPHGHLGSFKCIDFYSTLCVSGLWFYRLGFHENQDDAMTVAQNRHPSTACGLLFHFSSASQRSQSKFVYSPDPPHPPHRPPIQTNAPSTEEHHLRLQATTNVISTPPHPPSKEIHHPLKNIMVVCNFETACIKLTNLDSSSTQTKLPTPPTPPNPCGQQTNGKRG